MNVMPGLATLSVGERKLLQDFVDEHQLFYGPDPAIMRNHKLEPRTAAEDRALDTQGDPHLLNQVRGRVVSALAESFRMVEQMGAAPGAKWGDLVTAIFTASGDLSEISPAGIVTFAGVCQYPIKFVNKYWTHDPSVGVRHGDGFIHNDSRYGGIHNTDQSMMMPVFHDGELVCWVSSTIHEGENGAIEPGGMPAKAESRFDEGLKMSPFRIVEDFQVKRDILTFLQNSVRDPKLQYEDLKVKLHACMRLMDRVRAVIAEFGKDALIAYLRRNLEDTEAEVHRRIAELPDGVVRFNTWIDSTLREPALLKVACAARVKGDRMTIDLRGSSPQLSNRSVNAVLGSTKVCFLTGVLQNIWPDLPHNLGVLAAFDFETDRNSLIDANNDAPCAMSLLPMFRTITVATVAFPKFIYSLPDDAKARATVVLAGQYNQPATFVYGGLTQHMEVTGNFCADINGNGQGARENRDGEHSVSPLFGFMCDTGEYELAEEELPMVRLIAQHLARDRVGWGKYRGGLGYEQMVTARGTSMWGFMTGQSGSRFCSAPGLFGGYSCPAYPIAKVKDVNVFDWFNEHGNAALFPYDIVQLMNERPIGQARYVTADAGMTFEMVEEGEIYMICQGAGGGYGDILERDPEAVMQDLREDLISHDSAREIYRVVYDPRTLIVDATATAAARDEERAARKRRGKPFAEFTAGWVTDGPAPDLPYYGSWGDPGTIVAGWDKSRRTMEAGAIEPIFMPDPRELRIAELEARLAAQG
ncbi:hydantoinase B/oxoprolinase family protein [Zavarzinia compransoris]|uniref:Acetone carboxylase subunit alpha n=1 Tax=Zavarzinia compransoris TaxID=1264899 RepID=A0A317DSY2_9PROT|nr:hydantoinase B/oxoprolinase family protein [Zavarzinia compransoris]PWR17781.1 acetone carboxylase subunit alpha [Zavarzinia compransoris]TDP49310.1 N-methylhydantoinase B/oxoprolinase/acetone carboxylase alpha subunit [Zavarzinia compransoris]